MPRSGIWLLSPSAASSGARPSATSRAIYGTAIGTARNKVTNLLLQAADARAKHFRLTAQRFGGDVTGWSDGSPQTWP